MVRLAPQEIRTYFVTTVCAQRRRLFQVADNAELMMQVMQVMQTNREKERMNIHAFVLMPDHIHLVLTPAVDVSLEKAVQFLKGGYSFLLKSKLDVWERGYRERRIVSPDDFETAKSYVEQNPCAQSLCKPHRNIRSPRRVEQKPLTLRPSGLPARAKSPSRCSKGSVG